MSAGSEEEAALAGGGPVFDGLGGEDEALERGFREGEEGEEAVDAVAEALVVISDDLGFLGGDFDAVGVFWAEFADDEGDGSGEFDSPLFFWGFDAMCEAGGGSEAGADVLS